ncbi:YibE/F family protein [Patescibacteria group bacterium]|nr:YibE/F family protein [Patescibacteria group bacterium]
MTTLLVRSFFLLLCILVPAGLQAQEVHQELQETVKAKVLEIVEQSDRQIMGTDATTTVQTLRIELLAGEKVGQVMSLDNDIMVLEVGDVIFVNRLVAIDDTEYLTFKDIERRPQLFWMALLMVALVIGFSGWQGMRALISLGLSIFAIIFLLVPALLAGYEPALVSLVIAGVILASSLFLTHGFKPRVTIAFIGTFSAVGVTCLLAWLSVDWLRLTGFGSDASVYLNFSTGGTLDIAGLLLGSIIIGLLGVLDDVSITQASVVQELRRANLELSPFELYKRAINVGRDHVGSLVNTLALAYLGTALPLVMFYSRANADFWQSVNQEVIAAEILRIIIGSIGLILAVPFTTAVAAWYFGNREVSVDHDHEHGHHHHHSH